MAADGVMIDILPRLNMGIVDKVLADCKRIFGAAGETAGRDMAKGMDLGFADLSRNAEVAFRDVQRSMAQMDAAVADRVSAFNKGADAMIESERRVQAAIAETNRAITASREADAAVNAGRRTAPTARQPLIPIPRGVNTAGAVAAGGVVGTVIEGARIDARVQENMNRISSQQTGMANAESQRNINQLTQWSYQNAGKLGSQSSVENLTAGLQQAEAAGYRGQNAINLVETAFKEAQVTGAGFQETLSALNTQLHDTKEQTDSVNATLKQMQEISSQNVSFYGQVPLTPDERSQLMKSTSSYEPVLTALSPGADPASVLAQAQAMMAQLLRTGMSPDQSADNLSHFISSLNLNPGGKSWQMFAQLGGDPQQLSTVLQNQGPMAAFQMIQNLMAKQTGSDGLIHTPFHLQNDQLTQLAQSSYDNMTDDEKAYIAAHPEVMQGVGSPKDLRKAIDDGQLTNPNAAQDITALNRWQAQLTGLNPNIKKGGDADMTPTQVGQALFGNADMARTFDILNQAGQDLANRLNNILQGGQQNILEDSFKKATSTLDSRWHQLGDSLGSVSGELANSFLPVISGAVSDLKGFADFFQSHKGAAQVLFDVMEGIAVAWGAAKVANLFADLKGPFDVIMKGARTVGDLMSTRLPTQLAAEATSAEALATAEGTAATEVTAAGIGTKLGAVATAAGVFSTALLAAAAAIELFKNTDWNKLAQVNDANGGPGFGRFGPRGGAGQLPFGPPPNTPTPPPAPSGGAPRFGIPGHSTGGMIGAGLGQPLFSVRDTGADSVLGMLPNGEPVGLRGGEGILTPETVDWLGGKPAVDALNNGQNPWKSGHVVSDFYNSFAQGVAKYSPFGKYLEGPGQTLSSLENEQVDADRLQRKQTKGLADDMINFYSDQYAANGDTYAGPSLKTNSRSYSGSVMGAIDQAASDMGLNKSQTEAVKWIFSHESGFDPTISNGGGHGAPSNSKAYGLGQFLGHMNDKYGQMGAYSGDPYSESTAAIQYMIDRYGSPAAAKQYWAAHGNYSTGGVVNSWWGPQGPSKPSNKPIPSNHTDPAKKSAPAAKQTAKTAQSMTTGQLSGILDSVLGNKDGAPGANSPIGDRNIQENPSQQLQAEGSGFAVGGGLLGAAESAVAEAGSAAAGAFTFGAGGAAASQASNMLFSLTNRAIGYGGQLVGIGLEGLMETFLPNDSPGADPSKNIFGKMALGIAGAHKSGDNMAGAHAQPINPKKDLDKGAMQAKQQPSGHTFNFGDIHGSGTSTKELQHAVNHAVNIGTFAGT